MESRCKLDVNFAEEAHLHVYNSHPHEPFREMHVLFLTWPDCGACYRYFVRVTVLFLGYNVSEVLELSIGRAVHEQLLNDTGDMICSFPCTLPVVQSVWISSSQRSLAKRYIIPTVLAALEYSFLVLVGCYDVWN